MKLLKALPLLIVASLTACESYRYVDNDTQPLLLFGTNVSFKIKIQNHYNGFRSVSDVTSIFKQIDELADATRQREITNVWSLNQTNEKLSITEDFYHLLSRAKELQQTVKYFNPLIGSLSNKWKESLNLANEKDKTPTVLADEIIQEELAKMNSSELVLEETEQGWFAQRKGEALIDLGAVAKGYALDKCVEYLNNHTGVTEDYLINAGNSSILLGKNSQRYRVWKGQDYDEGVYIVHVTNIRNYENLRIFNSFVSTSGISEQKAEIDGKVYSHIINPTDGSAISNYDQVTIINDNAWGKGSLGDALSTSLMMSSEEEIKQAEKDFEIKVIALKDGKIEYQSSGITLYF